MLSLKNISIHIAHIQIVQNFSLTINAGSFHLLMGQNGSGKSSIVHAIIGHPDYQITAGTIEYAGESIIELTPDKRVKKGIFAVVQNPCTIPGVMVLSFFKEALFHINGISLSVQEIEEHAAKIFESVGLDRALLYRSVHDGFSGGQKKRFELAQVLLFKPAFIILDEIDAGLDIDGLRTVADVITQMRAHNPQLSILMITHNISFATTLQPDQVHCMAGGQLITSGNGSVLHDLAQRGYHANI